MDKTCADAGGRVSVGVWANDQAFIRWLRTDDASPLLHYQTVIWSPSSVRVMLRRVGADLRPQRRGDGARLHRQEEVREDGGLQLEARLVQRVGEHLRASRKGASRREARGRARASFTARMQERKGAGGWWQRQACR
eukprot:3375890-Pleurochrysis_carterae.AAC.1